MKFKTVIQSTRLPFLVLTPICVLLALGTVTASGSAINWPLLCLALCGAMLAHISVNSLNEYLDFKSGLDLQTKRTAFSGGSGALPNYPEASRPVFAMALSCMVLTAVIGLFFTWLRGWEILPIGIIGMLLIASYTQWINKHPILCLLAPGIGFGVLMTAGVHFVLTGGFNTMMWLAAAIPFFLVNNLLLLNQYPDIDADKKVGRKHFPIVYGTAASSAIYAVFSLAAIALIIISVLTNTFPKLSLLALIASPLAIFSFYGAWKHGGELGNHPQYMASNVLLSLLMPLLLGLSFIISSQ